jgi:hypothetical protein
MRHGQINTLPTHSPADRVRCSSYHGWKGTASKPLSQATYRSAEALRYPKLPSSAKVSHLFREELANEVLVAGGSFSALYILLFGGAALQRCD